MLFTPAATFERLEPPTCRRRGIPLRPAFAGAGREAVVTAGTEAASVETACLAMP